MRQVSFDPGKGELTVVSSVEKGQPTQSQRHQKDKGVRFSERESQTELLSVILNDADQLRIR